MVLIKRINVVKGNLSLIQIQLYGDYRCYRIKDRKRKKLE